MTKIYNGQCFCGSISYQVAGTPTLRAYCHCTNCQKLSGAPFIHTIHFPSAAFQWTNKDALIDMDSFNPPSKPYKTRYRCKNCGVCVASKNSLTEQSTIFGVHLQRDEKGALVDWDDLKPTSHIYYATHVLEIKDGLSKWAGYENQSEQLCA
ncbi:hypothetical protein H0H93_005802 [Arthromyces matolae]|nr:hypothetical protein H0H93_005802 [Arthromyces matolae]